MWPTVKELKDPDNNSVSKFIFTKPDACVESVLYAYPSFIERTVICCSTQSGCPVGCRFCGSGDFFNRSLTSTEIVAQVNHCLDSTGVDPNSIDKLQIMMMSMGEPMHNYGNLEAALIELNRLYPKAALLVSTSAPRVRIAFIHFIELSKSISQIGLQFSVHESTDEARKMLIPTPTMTLSEIAQTGEKWAAATGRKPFFNYCVKSNNNTVEDVMRLQALFNPDVWEVTLSVVCERDENVARSVERQESIARNFSQLMNNAGYSTRVFNPAGQDSIGGGCGQLPHFQKWVSENSGLVKHSAGFGLNKIHAPQ